MLRIRGDIHSLADSEIKKDILLESGQPFDRAKAEQSIENLYRKGILASVRYRPVEENGRKGVEFSVTEKNWYKRSFQFGLALEQDFENSSNFSLGTLFRFAQLNKWDAQAEVDAVLGESPLFATEWYQPLGAGSPYFIAPSASFRREDIDLMQDEDIVATYRRTSSSAQARVGREIGSLGEIYASYLYGSGKLDRYIGDPSLPESDFDLGEVSGSLKLDTQDSPDFPHRGFKHSLSYRVSSEGMGASDDFRQFFGLLSLPLAVTKKDTLILRGDFGQTYDADRAYRLYALGGFFDISGYPQNSLYAEDYAIGRALMFRQFSKLGSALFGLNIYGGITLEYASLNNDALAGLEQPSSIVAGSVFLGVDTSLAPFYLGFGLAEQGQAALYFSLGRLNTADRMR